MSKIRELEVEIVDNELTFLIEVRYEPGTSAITSGPPDNWDPGDPDEAMIIGACVCYEHSEFSPVALPAVMYEWLYNMFEDKILEICAESIM